MRGIVDTLTKAGFVTDSISLGDTKFMVGISLYVYCIKQNRVFCK